MSRVDLQSCVQRWKLNREIVKLKVKRFSSAQAGMLKIFWLWQKNPHFLQTKTTMAGHGFGSDQGSNQGVARNVAKHWLRGCDV